MVHTVARSLFFYCYHIDMTGEGIPNTESGATRRIPVDPKIHSDGRIWYRDHTGAAVVLDDAGEAEYNRQQRNPDSEPAEGFPKFSSGTAFEDLPPDSEFDDTKAAITLEVNNFVDLTADQRTTLLDELAEAEDLADLAAIRVAAEEWVREARAAAGAADGAGAAGGGAAGAGAAAGGGPGAGPRSRADRIADEAQREFAQAENRHIKSEAKRQAREQLDAELKAERETRESAAFAAEKDAYKARFDTLRVHGIIDDTNAVLAQDEVAHMATSEALKARFDAELKGLEMRLPQPPEAPEYGVNAVRNDAEFAQLAVEAIKNIEAVKDVGGNSNALYQRYRKRLRAGDLKQFDAILTKREKVTGKEFGIDYRSMSPAERMRIMNPPPAFANKYVEGGRIDRIWMAHSAEKYKALTPFSMDEINNDPKKKALYERFKMAVEYDNTLKETVDAGMPFDDAQRKLQEYSQYEFTYQYKRAEVLSEMFSPEFTKKLMYQNEFVNSIATMYGVEKTSAFLKDDVFRIAVENLATFDRLALSAWRLNQMGGGRFNAQSRGEEQFDMAAVMEERMRNADVQKAMQTEAFTGVKSVEELPKSNEEIKDKFSAASLQKYFDRDKMKAKIDGRGWDKWTAAERSEFKSKWEPEEIKKAREHKEKGLFAQLKAVLMEALFGEQKKHVSAH